MRILLSMAFTLVILAAALSLPLFFDPGAAPLPSPKGSMALDPVYDIRIHPDEKQALIRTLHHVSVQDVFSGEVLQSVSRKDFAFTTVAWVPGTELILAGCRDGQVQLLERFCLSRELPSSGHEREVLQAVVSPSGKIALTASEDCVCVWHLEQGRLLAKSPLDGVMPCQLELFPDEQKFLIGTRDGWLRIFQLEDAREIQAFRPIEESLISARLIDDGRKMLVVFYKSIVVIDATTGAFREIPSFCRGYFIGLDVSPDEKLFACSDWSNNIYLYSLETGRRIATLEGHTDGASVVTFSKSEPCLYSGGYDGTVRLWDLKTYAEISAYSANP